MQTLTRKEKEKLQRKEYILDAALDLFSGKGYEKTTIDEIAELAEFSKGSIYQYFKSKEEIYNTLFDRMISQLVEVILGIASSNDSPVVTIKKVIRSSFEYGYSNKKMVRLLMQRETELFGVSGCIKAKIDERVDQKFNTTLQKAIDEGSITKGNSEQLNFLVDGMMHKVLAHLILEDKPLEEYHTYADLICDVFFHGCA